MLDILKRFLHARNEYDKKHQSVDRDIDDRPDSDHTVLFPPISRSAIQRLHEQGQTRTLADIAMALNEQHPFSSYEEFEQSFSAVVSGYMKRGTVSAAVCEAIKDLIHTQAHELFPARYFDLDKFIERVDELAYGKNTTLDAIYSRREKTKLLRIIALMNAIMRYTSPDELIQDLHTVIDPMFNERYRSVNDSFHYPLHFFIRGIEHGWKEIQRDGCLDNALLEKVMFTNHEQKVAKLGIAETIKRDFIDNGPCHPEVYFPKVIGTAPVYVLEDTYIKSCGEGKGPNACPSLYEMKIVMPVLQRAFKLVIYKQLGAYAIPVKDLSRPLFDLNYGLLPLKTEAEKKAFIQENKK